MIVKIKKSLNYDLKLTNRENNINFEIIRSFEIKNDTFVTILKSKITLMLNKTDGK